MKKEDQNRSGEYEKSYGGSSYNKDERSHYTIRKEETVPPKARKEETIPPRDAGSVSEETPEQQTAQKMKRAKTIYKKLFMEAKLENLNFLKVNTKTKTTAKTVHSSAYHTPLSTGFIPLQTNNQI